MSSDTDDSSTCVCEEPDAEEKVFRQILLQRIDAIEATGSFATGSVLDAWPIPGICVDGGEPISVPLSGEAARNLAKKSDKAPFGMRGETLVDETVRKTLQIAAERISFKNPQWDGFVNKLVKRVAGELGVPTYAHSGTSVRAELYKHLLYEPGAMFKPHKDTEKSPGMFGTLVICLPSEHTGGTVCLQHGNDSLELSTAETSAFDSYYLAWYADVTHEIKPVQTGYRWVLTYNLIIDHGSSRLSASGLDSQIQSLVGALSPWGRLRHPPDFLVYPLVHQYTRRNVRLSTLKGLDYQRARCLADSCDRHGEFYLFVALLNKFKSWANDEGGELCMSRRRRYLHHVCSLDGFQLSPLQVDIDKTSLLSSIRYGRQPDSRTGGEYLGNQHGEIEEIYSDMVLVIVRADSLHAPLLNSKSPHDMGNVVRHLRAGIDDSAKMMPQKILVHLCRITLDRGLATEAANDECLGYAAVAAAFLGDWPLFEEARKKTLKAWDYGAWDALGGLIDLQDSPIEAEDIFESLMKCDKLWGVYQCLTHFYNGFCENNIGREDPAKAEYWKQWYSDKLIAALDACDNCSGEDDAAIIKDIASDLEIQYTPEQRKKMDEAVMGFVDRFTEAKVFVNVLNVEILLELSDPKGVRKGFHLVLFGVVSESAISTFDLDLYYKHARVFKGKMNTDVLIREFYNLALMHNEDSASDLLRQLSNQAFKAEDDTVREILMPVMKELLPSVNTGSPVVQTCFQSLVEAYITRTVDKEPSKPEDWARPAEVRDCYPSGCKPCSELNAFLTDPEAKEITMAVSVKDRGHIQWRFDYLDAGDGSCEGEVCYTKTLKEWEKCHRRWKSDAKAAQRKLQKLPKEALRQALGDKYVTLMRLDLVRIDKSTAQAPDKAQSPELPKRQLGEDANNIAPVWTPKRARLRGEQPEEG